MKKIVYIASDHAGFSLKNHLFSYLKDKNDLEIQDLGVESNENSVDYPDFAHELAKMLRDKTEAFGILICGSGIGMSIAANRHPHIRAARVDEPVSAKLSRLHNNANVLCLGARFIGSLIAENCVEAFLNTPFEGGRHEVRLQKLDLENS